MLKFIATCTVFAGNEDLHLQNDILWNCKGKMCIILFSRKRNKVYFKSLKTWL